MEAERIVSWVVSTTQDEQFESDNKALRTKSGEVHRMRWADQKVTWTTDEEMAVT